MCPSGQVPTAAQVIAALEGTGFLLEQRAAQGLRDAGFSVIINDAFPDPETGKSREIDVFGGMDYEIDAINLAVTARVLVECKNTPNPFVVVGTSRERWGFIDESIAVSFDPLSFDFRPKAPSSILSQLEIGRLPGDSKKQNFVGRQLVRLNRKSGDWLADNSSVYDSILYPLFKARDYHMARDAAMADERVHNIMRWEFPSITYLYPVLLTTGKIFTVAVNDNNSEPQVNDVSWTTLERIFNSSDLRSVLRVDIVNFDHFQEYLSQRVSSTVNNTYEEMTKNAHLYDPEWLYRNFGSPRHEDRFKVWLEAVRGTGAH